MNYQLLPCFTIRSYDSSAKFGFQKRASHPALHFSSSTGWEGLNIAGYRYIAEHGPSGGFSLEILIDYEGHCVVFSRAIVGMIVIMVIVTLICYHHTCIYLYIYMIIIFFILFCLLSLFNYSHF